MPGGAVDVQHRLAWRHEGVVVGGERDLASGEEVWAQLASRVRERDADGEAARRGRGDREYLADDAGVLFARDGVNAHPYGLADADQRILGLRELAVEVDRVQRDDPHDVLAGAELHPRL